MLRWAGTHAFCIEGNSLVTPLGHPWAPLCGELGGDSSPLLWEQHCIDDTWTSLAPRCVRTAARCGGGATLLMTLEALGALMWGAELGQLSMAGRAVQEELLLWWEQPLGPHLRHPGHHYAVHWAGTVVPVVGAALC